MARIEGLMAEIEGFFGRKVSSISRVYLLKKYFYIVGGASGFVVGLLMNNFFAFLVVAVIGSIVVYASTENYLLKIDHAFFTSPGYSRREIFDRYYAGEVGRSVALRMTEPEQLVRTEHLTVEQRRTEFRERLAAELDREFGKSDWRFFVAEALYYQKRC